MHHIPPQIMSAAKIIRLVKYICYLVEKGKGITAWLSLAAAQIDCSESHLATRIPTSKNRYRNRSKQLETSLDKTLQSKTLGLFGFYSNFQQIFIKVPAPKFRARPWLLAF